MTENTEYWNTFDKAFFDDGYKICDTFLSMGFTQKNLFDAQKQLYTVIDSFIDSFLHRTQAEGQASECKKGCSYCCHQTVLASPYELFYLAHSIKKKYSAATLPAIVERITNKYKNTSGLKLKNLLKHKEACPLLHSSGGFCMMYAARPMACRIYLSSSMQSCIDDLNSPNDNSVYPKLFETPLRAGRMMNEGFQARIRKGRMNNLQIFENSIEIGLHTALIDGNFEKWLRGIKVFSKPE